MKGGRGYRRQLRGDLAPVGQELDLIYASLLEWSEVEHTVDGHHTDITGDTIVIDGLTSFGGPWRMPLSAVLTPPYTITANQDNYNPRDLDQAIVVRLQTDASRTFTGLQTNKDEFRWLLLVNVGNFDIVLAHNSSSSQAIWRFSNPLGVNVTIGSAGSVLLWYDRHSGIWRTIASAGAVTGVVGAATVEDGDYGDVIVSDDGATFTVPGAHVHGLMRTAGDGTSTTFDLLDIADYLEHVSVDGNIVDPLQYSLSADGSQIVFDLAPTANNVIALEYVIAGT